MTTATYFTDIDYADSYLAATQSLSDDNLIARITQSIENLELHRARFLVGLGEFEARDLAESQGAANCVVWLAQIGGQSARAAQDYRTQARRLHHWPSVATHYLAGLLTYSKVRLILRYITVENEHELLELAQEMTCEELAQVLSGRPQNRDEEEAPEEFVSWRVDPDTGWAKLSGHFSPENAAKMEAALKLAELLLMRDADDIDTDQIDDEHQAVFEDEEEAIPSEDTTPEGAKDKPLIGSLDAETVTRRPGAPRDADPPARANRFGPVTARNLLPAMLAMVNSLLLTPKSKVNAPGAEVHMIVDVDGEVRIPGHLGAETAKLMDTVLNSALRVHLRTPDGVTAEMGSPKRAIPKWLAIMVLVAWGFQCAMPGCVHRRFLQFHHIVFFSHGGPTDPRNLIALCSGCHSSVTHGAVTIDIDPDDPAKVHFRMKNGTTYTSTRRHVPVINHDADDTPRITPAVLDQWSEEILSFAD